MFRCNSLKQFTRFSTINGLLTKPQKRNLAKSFILHNKKEYTDSDEWLYHTKESTRLGLTTKAIEEMTELVYIEFIFNNGDIIKENEEVVIIESVKAATYIKAPFDCVLLQNNIDHEDDLINVNSDPENIDTSWIIEIDKIP
jgi:glycine cleavage system H protein